MTSSELMKTVKSRKSVRTYDGNPLSAADRQKIEEYIKEIKNPFDIDVDFTLLDAKEHGLSSPVLKGETLYVAAKTDKIPYADVAFGYSFEKLVLYAWSLGIGTVWIGGTMKRETFQAALGLEEGKRMPCVSPLGYPAKHRSVKEVAMRTGVGADSRKDAKNLFFDKTPDTPLVCDDKAVSDALEMVRWAPSAVNKQPWRVIADGNLFHFYEKQDKGYVNDSVGDLQKVDVGIALAHFILGLESAGKEVETVIEDPSIKVNSDMFYIATVKIK
jgi:nitroreductase